MLTPSPDPGLSDGYPPTAPPRQSPSPRARSSATRDAQATRDTLDARERLAREPEPAANEPEPTYRVPAAWRRVAREAFGGHRAWAAGEMRHAPLEVRVNIVVRTALLVGALLAGAVMLWHGHVPGEAGTSATVRVAAIALLLALAFGIVALVGIAAGRTPHRVRAGFRRVDRLDR